MFHLILSITRAPEKGSVLSFLVHCSFAAQEIQANHETLVKINAAAESEYSVITEN